MKRYLAFIIIIIAVVFGSCNGWVEVKPVEPGLLYGRWMLERIRTSVKDGEDTMHSKVYRMIEITRDSKFITDPVYNPSIETFTLTNNIIKTPTQEYTIIVLENNRLELGAVLPNGNNTFSSVTLDFKR